MKRLLMVGLLGFAGCGGGGSELVVDARGTKLAAVHDGDRWSPLTLDSAGIAKLDVGAPTLVSVVCDDPRYFNYYTIAVGPGTERLTMACPSSIVTHNVTIDAGERTQVAIGFARTGPGLSKTLVLADGIYDVIAVDTALMPPRVEIRRGIPIHADMALSFRLATDGVPMTKVDVTLTGAAAGEAPELSGFAQLGSRDLPTVLTWSTRDVWVVPESLRRPDDLHSVSAATIEPSSYNKVRRASTRVGPELAYNVALPPYASATVSPGVMPSLSWSGGDPAFDDLYFGISNANLEKLWDILVMPTWVEAGGDPKTLTLPDPHALPQWQLAWDIPAELTDFTWQFQANHNTPTAGTSAFIAEPYGTSL